MRGKETFQETLFSYVSTEARIPKEHPLRTIRQLADTVLVEMDETFENQYSQVGRPSIPPEFLIRATVLQIFHSIRSERLLMEQLDYNLLFRWFVGLSVDQEVWNHSTFSKNRERLLTGIAANEFFARVVGLAEKEGLLSDEHFSVDGTLIESWASLKSFRAKDGSSNPPRGRDGTQRWIFGAKNGRTTRMNPRRIRKRGLRRRPLVKPPKYAMLPMLRWRTGTAWRWIAK